MLDKNTADLYNNLEYFIDFDGEEYVLPPKEERGSFWCEVLMRRARKVAPESGG